MNEEVSLIIEDAQERMDNAIEHLEVELSHVRAGKASPKMLDGVMVDYYGSMTPLNQVANVNTPDARTIAIQPWEKAMIGPIEKAIINANLGFNPDNNGEMVRVNVPVLTEERRKDLVKEANQFGESARIGIRSARKDANDQLKKLLKDGLSEDLEKDAEGTVQDMTNKSNKTIDSIISKKEDEIMTV